MSVDVCFLRRKSKSGLARFRKNIISFHQDLLELKQYYSFLTDLKPRDIVNVTVRDTESGELKHRRARVREFKDSGIMAEIDGEDEPRFVHCHEITQRAKLPWKPKELYNDLIVFRRRDADKNDYIDEWYQNYICK